MIIILVPTLMLQVKGHYRQEKPTLVKSHFEKSHIILKPEHEELKYIADHGARIGDPLPETI